MFAAISKENKNRIISFAILISIVIAVFSNTAITNAVKAENLDETTEGVSLSEVDIPETLEYNEVLKKGHIKRMYEEETDLNTAIFENEDGSRTMYMFEENIKYVTRDGEVRDKSNELVKTEDGYTNKENDIKVHYGESVSGGIKVSFDDKEITITPFGTEKSDSEAELQRNENGAAKEIIFKDVFGEGTRLVYVQQLSGYKEDIILDRDIGRREFSFFVKAEGFRMEQLAEAKVKTVFVNEETGKPEAELGNIIMWDSAGHFAAGEYVIAKTEVEYEYVVTIDATALLDEEGIVYPVTIDPSMNIGVGSSTAIEDTTIFTNYNSCMGTCSALFVGNYNTWAMSPTDTRGTARAFVKFPALMSDATFYLMYQTGVLTSVKYCFADVWCLSGPSILNAYLCTESWNENAAVYTNSLWNSLGTYVGSTTVSPIDPAPTPFPRYEIDITLAIDKWKSGTTNNGIVLKANDESLTAVSIASSERGVNDGQSVDKPYVIVNYDMVPNSSSGSMKINSGSIYRIKNVGSGKYLSVHKGLNKNGANVYQKADETITGTNYYSQEFKIEYDTSESACRIRAMCSIYGRRRVLDVKKSGDGIAGLTSGCNVQTYKATDNIAQLFKFIPVDDGYYKIVLKYNDSLALTSYGNNNGSSGGTSNTSSGNIFVADYTGSDNQKWQLELMVTSREKLYYGLMGLEYPFRGNTVPTKISSGYGYRVHPISGNIKMHKGIDIPANSGTNLYSAINGTVVEIGYDGNTTNGKGHYIIIEASNDYNRVYDSATTIRIVYMHMIEEPTVTNSNVYMGATVTTQTIVGKVGETGAATAPHLHYGIIKDGSLNTGDGHVTNPIAFYPNFNFTF